MALKIPCLISYRHPMIHSITARAMMSGTDDSSKTKKREHYAPAEFLGKSQREMRLR